MAQGKPQPSARKRGRQPARVSAGGSHAQTFVEEVAQSLTVPQEMDDLYVDDDVAAPKGKNGASARNGAGAVNGSSSADKKKRKAKRAAERRRARGDAPAQVDGTNTALQQRRAPATGVSGQLNYAAGVLTCVKGPEEGLALNLLEGSYTIGRGRDNSFVLKDIAASRRHVRVEVSQSRVTVEDMGSGNGTRVNGKRIEKATLKNGDRVELGNSVLVFTYLGNDRSHPSLPPTTGDVLAKDAQERIVAAAERLAAELSERLRAEDELDDGAPTAHARGKGRSSGPSSSDHGRIDSGIDEVLTASANREHDKGRRSPVPMPDELWNETETKIPLSDVVPVDQPLAAKQRSPSKPKAAAAAAPSHVASDPGTNTIPPPAPSPPVAAPRPAVQEALRELEPVGPQMMPQGVAVEPRSRSWALGVALSFSVMLALGGAVFAGYWLFFRDDPSSFGGSSGGGVDDEFTALTTRATEALGESDYAAALAFAERALELRPDDAATKALLVAIRTAKAEAEEKASDPAPGGDGASASSPPKEPAPKPRAEAPKPAPEPKKVEAKAPEPPAARRAEEPRPAKVSKPKPRPKPRPRPARRGVRRAPEPKGMSDAEAKSVYIEAMRAVRGDDEQRGCALIRKVAREAPGDSAWKAKAKNALGRYGCE